jgi:aromatic-L-amino-acid/L-tryptophan decarboxylase
MQSLEISPQQFRHLASRITQLAADYLESLDSRSTFPNVSRGQTEEIFRLPPPEQGLQEKAFDELGRVLEYSRVQNGRFFGYVLGSGEPVSALADLLASVLNQNVTAWRSGPAAVTIECYTSARAH